MRESLPSHLLNTSGSHLVSRISAWESHEMLRPNCCACLRTNVLFLYGTVYWCTIATSDAYKGDYHDWSTYYTQVRNRVSIRVCDAPHYRFCYNHTYRTATALFPGGQPVSPHSKRYGAFT